MATSAYPPSHQRPMHGRQNPGLPAMMAWAGAHPRWVVLLVLLAVALGAALWHPTRVAAKTLLVLPEIFPDAPVRPLLWLTAAPRHEERSEASPSGHLDVDLYEPSSGGQHGAVILYVGAYGLRRDPAVVRFAEGLARSGAVVMVPESAALREGELLPAEAETLLQTVGRLREHPAVDAARVGIFGFSAGGSLVLLAAEQDPDAQIAFVNIFGSYYDAEELLRAAASREIEVDGELVAWEPAEVTAYTFAKQVISPLPEARDREILGRAFLEKQTVALADADQLSPDGRLVLELLQGPSNERAAAIIAALPPASRERLAAVSPSLGVSHLRASLYLMHDRSDSYIPFTHSRRLAAEAPPGTLRAYTEFDLFGHTSPNRQLAAPIFVRELLRLFQHARLVAEEFL